MQKRTASLLCAVLAISIIVGGCDRAAARLRHLAPSNDETRTFMRDIGSIEFGGMDYTPWDVDDVAANVGTRDIKPYTIMIYMNGSDLESEHGEATKDIKEMLSSGVDTELYNIIIFTGGTYRWQNNTIPSDECAVWRLTQNGLEKIAGIGLWDMGNAGTLSSFIRFGMQCFPADKFGLILWDHGGGAIAGYGHDELWGKSSLSLLELDYAFNQAGLAANPLEFIGFDACLMATVEMAVIASQYARYFTASQDLEPGDGWDYVFLQALNANPGIDGAELGRVIADTYMDFYGPGSVENLTMSVTDLTRVKNVMGEMGTLMNRGMVSLAADRARSMPPIARRRQRTKTFGMGSRRDNDSDMVDIADMARRLRDIFPEEAARVQTAVSKAVIYNRHNSLTNIGGLAAYYIFGGKDNAENMLGVYSSLNMSAEYTEFLKTFAGLLDDAHQTDPDGMWAIVEGEHVYMYKVGENDCAAEYAVPVTVNGETADLIITFCGYAPRGMIRGYRKCNGYMKPKGLSELSDVDVIEFQL